MNWRRRTLLLLSITAFLSVGALRSDDLKPSSEGKPAPVNDFQGMQEREEVFEFTQKPAVKREGGKWAIAFASKGACDATVSILDKDGMIIRHLASGVLGRNAPWPFQQNSLSQRIEWDGLKDDFSRADAAGCQVKVSLGLKPRFERNLAYDPYLMSDGMVGTGADGSVYLLNTTGYGAYQGRVFKDGKYARTFWPPPATDIEKAGAVGYQLATTDWGDKAPVYANITGGPFSFQGDGRNKSAKDLAAAMFKFAGIADYKKGARPAGLFEPKVSGKLTGTVFAHYSRIAVDAERDELYVSGLSGTVRFSGKTGDPDSNWKQQAWTEVAFGSDGLIYGRFGESGHGKYLIRTDPAGKMAPFTENTLKEPLPKEFFKDGFGGPPPGVVPGVLLMGNTGTGNVYQNGLHVAVNGQIVAEVHSRVITEEFSNPNAVRVALADSNKAVNAYKALGVKIMGGGIQGDGEQDYFVMVWESNGKRVTQNAVEGRGLGDGVYMDRDGNIYMVQGGVRAAGQGQYGKGKIDGVKDVPIDYRRWGGAGGLFKFRGQGGKYPVGKFYGKIPYGGGDMSAPADATKLSDRSVTGALWFYDGITGQSVGDCNCGHSRFYLDSYARSWIPAAQLCSIMLLDSNGNRIARLGKYGNVDDSDADVKGGKDGLRFVWTRSVCASDSAMYAVDYGNRRILKAALSYAAEVTVAVP